eukprot:TRINITY_DN11115_c0_g1_i1.p1 TRINITY_DN11115_c0_g1~~TRINITY_DN11115_c0_g1_i1.p1  ORF type:complete len:259 (-),score=48.00 TRINITY_DN11115_c0_g1_i1:69-815(-)
MASAADAAPALTYAPFAFEVGQCPFPIEAILDPTPAERREAEERDRLAKQQQKEATLAREAEEKKKAGIMGKLTTVTANVANTVQKGVLTGVATAQKTALHIADEHAVKRYQTAFPTLSAAETLLGDFSCKVLNTGAGAVQYAGYLQITNGHVCFVGDNKLSFSFPLADVVSVQRAVTLPTENNGLPYVMQIPAPNVVATAILVYTAQNQMHVFAYFPNMRDALNVLDHAWRALVAAPVMGYPYKHHD